jgi:predicted DNA-binding transcriptional regulator YafY
MANQRYNRHIGIVQQLRARTFVSSTSLATRFSVSPRTIYRDIEELIAAGLPIESVAGRDGGYRLGSEGAVDPLIMDADDVLRLYVLSLIDTDDHDALTGAPGAANGGAALLQAGGVSTYARDTLRKLSQRIYFDTRDWYWKDEGSGHVPALRYALLTSTAIEITFRNKRSDTSTSQVVKPYGLVWKGGEWWLVATPLRGDPERFRLNHIDRLVRTDLTFTHPGDAFDLRQWWTQTLEDFGRGPNQVRLRVHPPGREEMLRLGLKPDSEIIHEPDGTIIIVLYVDRWQWLVPLVASFGADVTVEEPAGLRADLRSHHERALRTYLDADNAANADYRNDDSRLRATRGRNPRSVRPQTGPADRPPASR